MHTKLWEQTLPFWQECKNQTIAIALSGGLDSVVLLHLANRAKQEYGMDIQAIHIHHGLQEKAEEWAEFCTQLAQQYLIPIEVKRVHVMPKKMGIEAAARQARYQALQNTSATMILTAHHRDDQIETLLLALLRGGGARALASMPICGNFHHKILARPLLSFSRATLEAYAHQHQLKWIEDPSNQNTHFLRNWLRHEWIPALNQHLPHASEQLLASIQAAQEDLRLADEIVHEDWTRVFKNNYFDCQIWAKLTPARRRLLLRHFLVSHGMSVPSQAALYAWEQQLSTQENGTGMWVVPQGKIHAAYGRLWIEPPQFLWEKQFLTVKDGIENAAALPENWQAAQIRSVHQSETIRLHFGFKKIRHLLQNYRIPVFMRHRWPVLVLDNEILAVCNLRLAVNAESRVVPCISELNQWMVSNTPT